MATKNFKVLRDKMPAERRAKNDARIKAYRERKMLSEIRKQRGITQSDMAEGMDVPQSSISKIEGRTDILVSTLSEYIHALGGELQLRAVFPDEEIFVSLSNIPAESSLAIAVGK